MSTWCRARGRTHRIGKISLPLTSDFFVTVVCDCGQEAVLAEWQERAHRGWNQRQWARSRAALFAAVRALVKL